MTALGTRQAVVDFTYRCPNCKHPVSFVLTPAEDFVPESPEDWLIRTPQTVQRLFKDLDTAGMVSALRFAVGLMLPGSRPKNIYKFFLHAANRAQRVETIPQAAWFILKEHFAGHVEIYTGNGLAIVVCQGVIRALTAQSVFRDFVDIAAPIRRTTTSLTAKHATASKADPREWVKTRFGYVTSPIVYAELHRRSLGAFQEVTA